MRFKSIIIVMMAIFLHFGALSAIAESKQYPAWWPEKSQYAPGCGAGVGKPLTRERMQWLMISSRVIAEAKKQKSSFGENPFSCSVTIAPDGSIKNAKVVETSGFNDAHQLALNCIKSAAPFEVKARNLRPLKDLNYSIEFPPLKVSQINSQTK